MLTADGARLLRQVRDHILAHPEEFGMNEWDCGTYACIGGHLARIGGVIGYPLRIPVMLGFASDVRFGAALALLNHESPLHTLLYTWDRTDSRNAHVAADRINAFLWRYGYPPNEVLASEANTESEVGVHN